MDETYFIPNEADLFLVEQYRDFLPKKIFDAHMHMPHGKTIPAYKAKVSISGIILPPKIIGMIWAHYFPV